MRHERKFRAANEGKAESDLTRLKILWRDKLKEDERDHWRGRLSGQESQAQLRADIRARWHIHLKYDAQLSKFRDWDFEQQQRELEAERAAADEKQIHAEHPEWTLDDVRNEVFRRTHMRALAFGDFRLGLAAAKVSLNADQLRLDRDKWELEAAAKMLDRAVREKADEINASSMSQAEKIAAMRRAAFKSVDDLEASGKIKLPK